MAMGEDQHAIITPHDYWDTLYQSHEFEVFATGHRFRRLKDTKNFITDERIRDRLEERAIAFCWLHAMKILAGNKE